jgi:two-component system, NarL family, response regulator NreC
MRRTRLTQRADAVIRVALVDVQTIVREGLGALIGHEPGLEVVAQTTGVPALEELDIDPDVVVTALPFPDLGVDEVIGRLRRRFRDASIVVLSAFDDLATVQQVLAAGANGYVLQSAAADDLFVGIRTVAHGGLYLQPSIAIAFASRSPEEISHSAATALTAKETEVLKLLALGHTNVAIATLTGSSLRTIETHRAHIHQKLDRHTRAELVRFALDTGLLRVDEQVDPARAAARAPHRRRNQIND